MVRCTERQQDLGGIQVDSSVAIFFARSARCPPTTTPTTTVATIGRIGGTWPVSMVIVAVVTEGYLGVSALCSDRWLATRNRG